MIQNKTPISTSLLLLVMYHSEIGTGGVPMLVFSAFLVLSFSSSAFAGEVARPAARPSSQPHQTSPVELGKCQPPDIDEEKTVKGWAGDAGLSKEEILARLIYSESLSTGYWKKMCNAESEEAIMRNIGWGVMYRVNSKLKLNADGYYETIFQKSQFRTSFARNYKDQKASLTKENPFAKAFLCPLSADTYLKDSKSQTTALKLFQKSREIAKSIIEEYEKTKIPSKYQGITNFFYPKSEIYGHLLPNWAKDNRNEMVNLVDDYKTNPCVESYKLGK